MAFLCLDTILRKSSQKMKNHVISYCISVNKRDVWEVNGLLEDFGLTTI